MGLKKKKLSEHEIKLGPYRTEANIPKLRNSNVGQFNATEYHGNG
jgi:hypothetical protein